MSEEGLSQAIGLRPGQMIAAVGGGGKTSLLGALARECTGAGWQPVIMTTTTHILAPGEGTLLLGDAASVKGALDRRGGAWTEPITMARLRAGEVRLPGISDEVNMKLRGFSAAEAGSFRTEGGALLIEADGSRGLPIKAPGPDEPVIPAETDIVLGVIGLDALGAPVDQAHVFRPERLSEVAGLAPGDAISAESIGRLAAHPDGLFRNAPGNARRFIVLNKSDLIGDMEKLEQIGYIISDAACGRNGPAEAVLFTSFIHSESRVVYRAP